ncbi:MAG: hypothetical protein JXR13_03685 [Thalassovita sp.]
MTFQSLTTAKLWAKRLRRQLSEVGQHISHSRALEIVARQQGFRDWNAMAATLVTRTPAELYHGARVTGRYLSVEFCATVRQIYSPSPGLWQLSLDLEQPIDVVRFASFSNWRHQIMGVIGEQGTSREVTSDNCPHLIVDL